MVINEYNIFMYFLSFTSGTAGGQTVTLTGQGFSDDVEATIYGNLIK